MKEFDHEMFIEVLENLKNMDYLKSIGREIILHILRAKEEGRDLNAQALEI